MFPHPPGKFHFFLLSFYFCVNILFILFFLVWKPSRPLRSTLKSPPHPTLALDETCWTNMHTRPSDFGSLWLSFRVSPINSCISRTYNFPHQKWKNETWPPLALRHPSLPHCDCNFWRLLRDISPLFPLAWWPSNSFTCEDPLIEKCQQSH